MGHRCRIVLRFQLSLRPCRYLCMNLRCSSVFRVCRVVAPGWFLHSANIPKACGFAGCVHHDIVSLVPYSHYCPPHIVAIVSRSPFATSRDSCGCTFCMIRTHRSSSVGSSPSGLGLHPTLFGSLSILPLASLRPLQKLCFPSDYRLHYLSIFF